MRLAQIVEQKDGKLPIPEAFRRMLGPLERPHQNASVFRVHLCSSGQPLITTIPPRSWPTVLRISVLLEHRVGQLSTISEILTDLGINILLMEGYGYHPDEEGWWSAVIDFPALHRKLPPEGDARSVVLKETKKQLAAKVQELLERLLTLSEGLRRIDFPIDGPTDIGGFALVKDGRFFVKIEPMKLQRLVPDLVEDLMTVRPCRVVRNSIHLESDAGPATRKTRKLMLCNTEERFIRLVDTDDLAEIDLEVHTEAQDDANEGVGVLAMVTRILRDFEPKDESGRRIAINKGINIAFTYNYIMTDGEPKNVLHGTSETSVIKMFLESPQPIAKLPSREQCRIWGDLFEKLLEAKRGDGEQPFAKIKGSCMTIWHRKKRLFRADKNRKIQEVGLIPRLVNRFLSPERAADVKLFAVSIIVAFLCTWLSGFSDLLNSFAKVFAGAAVVFFVRVFWPGLKH